MATATLLPTPAAHPNHLHLSHSHNRGKDERQHHITPAFHSRSRSRSRSLFPHSASEAAEQEYDRLRTLSQSEHDQRHNYSERASAAYHRGDHAAAHELSERAKEHGRQADAIARQASVFIFNELNKPGLVDEDTVDLHGQYVNEAEEIIERRLDEAQQKGRNGLTVIVGIGNHSAGHVSKLKPCVETICRKRRVRCSTETHNHGRIYIDLVGGSGNDGKINDGRVDDYGSNHHYHHQQQQQQQQADGTTYTEKYEHQHQQHQHHPKPEKDGKDEKHKVAIWKRLKCCVVM